MLDSTVLGSEIRNPKELPADAWPPDGLEIVSACPVCGVQERHLEHKGLRDRLFFTAPGSWDMYRCAICGSGYLDPRPSASTIGLAYSSYYTHTPVAGSQQTPKSRLRRHRLAQRNAYLNETYGYELVPATKRSPRLLSTARRQRWDKQIGYLRFPGPGARLLDIGCGNGRFMMQMQDAGWKVTGIEPDPAGAARAVSAGLNVRTGSIDTLEGIDREHFDAVSLHHVIEHLHRPHETLQRCREVLKPGGNIVIATPNFAAFGHRIFGPDWFPLSPPTHLVMFTPDSLQRALKAAGFEPEPSYRLRVGSTEVFRQSLQIRRGGDPMRMQPRLSLAGRMRAAWLAWQADRATRELPELAEELVLLARRKD